MQRHIFKIDPMAFAIGSIKKKTGQQKLKNANQWMQEKAYQFVE